MKTMTKSGLLLLGLSLTACSSDSNPINDTGTPVAARVSAGIGGATRATGNQWNPDDCIGISGKSGNKTYTNMQYNTSGDGDFSHVGGEDSGIFFQTTDAVTFSAYYPFTGSENTEAGVISDVKTDDQTNSKDFDFLFASGATASAANPAILFTDDAAFKHCMTRLVVKVKAGDGFSATDIATGTFSISGIKHSGTFNTATGEAVATGDATEDWSITPAAANAEGVRIYDMILYPQSGTDIILKASFDGTTYGCVLASGLEAGKSNTYAITVNKTGISVSDSAIEQWIESPSYLKGASAITPPIGDKPMESVQPGDFYFSDGTFADKDAELVEAQANACIGIVFHAGHHQLDYSDYSDSGIGQEKCHGYVLALTDVNNRLFHVIYWAKAKDLNNIDLGTSTDVDNWNGYSNQKIIEKYALENTGGLGRTNFDAAYCCSVYGTGQSLIDWHKKFAAPANSSGWFLPSRGQLMSISPENSDKQELLQNQFEKLISLGVDNVWWMEASQGYWTSTEYKEDITEAWVMYPSLSGGSIDFTMDKRRAKCTRAILAY